MARQAITLELPDEVYTKPYEASDTEIVIDEGKTKGLVEGVRLSTGGVP